MMQGDDVKPNHTGRGVSTILASVAAMAFADAVVKLVSADLTVWQVFVTRSFVAIPIIAALLFASGVGLRFQSPKWAIIRSGLLVLAWLLFYAALPVLSLSVAAVAVYTTPIMIALLSAALIGEPVSGRQWTGVVLGFLGVLAILKPGSDGFSWFVLLPLLCAVFYAFAMILTRSKCQAEAPLTLALSLHSSFVVAGLIATLVLAVIGLDTETRSAYPFLLGDWAPMGMREWGLMVLIGVLSAVYFAGVAYAYQVAAPSIIATFDYAYLVSAAIWGIVLFAEIPDLLTVCGMVLITMAGLLVAGPFSKRVPEKLSETA